MSKLTSRHSTVRSLSFRQLLPAFFSLAAALLLPDAAARAESCQWNLEPQTLKVEWTAFKTTDRLAVSGRFAGAHTEGASTGPTVPDLLKRVLVRVDASSVDSGNPTRDATLKRNFFAHLSDHSKIQGRVVSVNGDDASGSWKLALKMNGSERTLSMGYTVTPEGAFTGTGGFSLLDFGAGKPLAELNRACKDLHQGKDGVSKTWPDVELKITARAKKICN